MGIGVSLRRGTGEQGTHWRLGFFGLAGLEAIISSQCHGIHLGLCQEMVVD